MSRLVKGLEDRLVLARDDYPTLSRISADCQSTVLKRQSSQVTVIPMPMPIVTLENGLTHCPMSNPVATRTIHRRAMDRIYHSIYLTPNWRWIGTCQANRWRIRCQSHVNRRTEAALNLGTSQLYGPTTSLHRGQFLKPTQKHNSNQMSILGQSNELPPIHWHTAYNRMSVPHSAQLIVNPWPIRQSIPDPTTLDLSANLWLLISHIYANQASANWPTSLGPCPIQRQSMAGQASDVSLTKRPLRTSIQTRMWPIGSALTRISTSDVNPMSIRGPKPTIT